jgi:hypothetical protein
MRKFIDSFCEENEVELVTADGYDDAIIGVTVPNGFTDGDMVPRVVYNRDKVIEILMADGMDDEEAEEFFAFNIIGAFVGEKTPLFITLPAKS